MKLIRLKYLKEKEGEERHDMIIDLNYYFILFNIYNFTIP
jgi:hypothetical protein